MDAAFASIAFVQPAGAETNLALLEQRLPSNLWATLPALLAQLPDPDGALNYLERYLRPETGEGAQRQAAAHSLSYLKRNPAALHHLLVIFSYSRFLSEMLVQQPELVIWLHRPMHRTPEHAVTLDRIKAPEELHEEFARFEATTSGLTPATVLARFKRREFLRITLRDVLGLATLAETALELSHLADTLLQRALRTSEQILENAYGTPQHTDAAGNRMTSRMTILSLGKLGGRELNYSSDIDLMFLYNRKGETSGGSQGRIANSEFHVRLAQSVLKLITEITPEGAVFRVDLRLRPQGHEGDLATSLPSALDYYQSRAREWELQMLIKARCSAGDLDSARAFLRTLQPLIYRPEFNLVAVEAVLNARQEITRKLERNIRGASHAAERNVKLSPGGIRDIEFLTQCLQRLYGGADPWLRTGSTLVGLQRLHDKGHLTGRDFFRLGAAYQFLRKVEHRLQLRDGVQRHTLPERADALERLARRCGVEPALPRGRSAADQLLHRLSQHFSEVRDIYDRILARQSPEPFSTNQRAEADPGSTALFRRLRSEFPALAKEAAEALAAIPEEQEAYARRGLFRYLGSAVLHGGVMEQLEGCSGLTAKLATLFARSDLAAEMLSRNPEEVSIVADPNAATPLEALAANAALDRAMADIRIWHRRSALAALVRALLDAVPPFETFLTFSRLADRALAFVFDLALQDTFGGGHPAASDSPLAVIALGRLGTNEMDVGSDADLVFVVETHLSTEQREPWRRLAERFVHLAGSHTRAGLLFPVDTRLRPHGSQGEIVLPVSALLDYFRTDAQAWEAATFLKARAVAANVALGAEAIKQLHAVLAERFADTGELARQLAHMRDRIEQEHADASHPLAAKGEFKKFAGGFYDIEYALAFLFLARGLGQGVAPGGHVLRQIAALESASVETTGLSSAQAQSLRIAALLYRSMDHAVRLITGRAPRGLPEPALAARVLRQVSLWNLPLNESIESEIERSRQQVRSLYEEIVLAAR